MRRTKKHGLALVEPGGSIRAARMLKRDRATLVLRDQPLKVLEAKCGPARPDPSRDHKCDLQIDRLFVTFHTASRFNALVLVEYVMRVPYRSALTGAAIATLFGSSAHAGVILAGPTPAMATDQSFSLNFNSGAATAGLSFILDGYLSLDGQNFYEDDFLLKLNNNQIFSGKLNLGGGSNSGSQANVYSNPFAAILSNPTNNGTGTSFNGGKETFSFAGLPVNIGSNTLTFTYMSLADATHAGFQGLGDEGWGVEHGQLCSRACE